MKADHSKSHFEVWLRVRPFTASNKTHSSKNMAMAASAKRLASLNERGSSCNLRNTRNKNFLGTASTSSLSRALSPVPRTVELKGLEAQEGCLYLNPDGTDLERDRYSRTAEPKESALKKKDRSQLIDFPNILLDKTTNKNLFDSIVKPRLNDCFDGKSLTFFTYGISGSGKTHTIFGSQELQEEGVLSLTMEHFLQNSDESSLGKIISMDMTFLEIYNEKVFDLFGTNFKGLQLLESPNFDGIIIPDLQVKQVKTMNQFKELILTAHDRRMVCPNLNNASSSRSHVIVEALLTVQTPSGKFKQSRLRFIDLAGSEKIYLEEKDIQTEGANINKSLLALGSCFEHLASDTSSQNSSLNNAPPNFVPYRNSKLTRLLKDSLNFTDPVIMIVCLSSQAKHFEETLLTIKYAMKALKIKPREAVRRDRYWQDLKKKKACSENSKFSEEYSYNQGCLPVNVSDISVDLEKDRALLANLFSLGEQKASKDHQINAITEELFGLDKELSALQQRESTDSNSEDNQQNAVFEKMKQVADRMEELMKSREIFLNQIKEIENKKRATSNQILAKLETLSQSLLAFKSSKSAPTKYKETTREELNEDSFSSISDLRHLKKEIEILRKELMTKDSQIREYVYAFKNIGYSPQRPKLQEPASKVFSIHAPLRRNSPSKERESKPQSQVDLNPMAINLSRKEKKDSGSPDLAQKGKVSEIITKLTEELRPASSSEKGAEILSCLERRKDSVDQAIKEVQKSIKKLSYKKVSRSGSFDNSIQKKNNFLRAGITELPKENNIAEKNSPASPAEDPFFGIKIVAAKRLSEQLDKDPKKEDEEEREKSEAHSRGLFHPGAHTLSVRGYDGLAPSGPEDKDSCTNPMSLYSDRGPFSEI